MIRLGALVSDPVGISIESTCTGSRRRISVRAWHPLVSIPAVHFSIEEFAHALGLIVPERKKSERKGVMR